MYKYSKLINFDFSPERCHLINVSLCNNTTTHPSMPHLSHVLQRKHEDTRTTGTKVCPWSFFFFLFWQQWQPQVSKQRQRMITVTTATESHHLPQQQDHHPRKQALMLVFDGGDYLPSPPPSITLQHEAYMYACVGGWLLFATTTLPPPSSTTTTFHPPPPTTLQCKSTHTLTLEGSCCLPPPPSPFSPTQAYGCTHFRGWLLFATTTTTTILHPPTRVYMYACFQVVIESQVRLHINWPVTNQKIASFNLPLLWHNFFYMYCSSINGSKANWKRQITGLSNTIFKSA